MNNKKLLAFIAVVTCVVGIVCVVTAVLLMPHSAKLPAEVADASQSAAAPTSEASGETETSSKNPTESQPEESSKQAEFSGEFPVESGEPEQKLVLPPEAVVSTPIILVYDSTAEEVLYARNETELKAPASLTKLLTAIVALEHLDEEQALRVGKEIELIGENSSTAFLSFGSSYRVKTLIEALLLPSGNDAAYVLAVNTARAAADDASLSIDSALADFVRLMNDKARAIGCFDSNFCTPDGYDADGQVTTASDMLKIAEAARKVKTIRETVAKPKSSGWENSNALLRVGSDYYRPEVTGMKTGSTDAAGFSIVVSADINGSAYVLVFMGAETAALRNDDVITFLDCIKSSGAAR